MLLIGFFITVTYIHSMIVDDGCEVKAVDILPDKDGKHHYILHMNCVKTGNRTMDVLTHDSPPISGPLHNPSKDYGIVFIIIGIVTMSLGIVLGIISLYHLVECFRQKHDKVAELSYPMLGV